MTYFDLYPEHYQERYEEQEENVRCCRGHCVEFPPAARVHTPERLEACLVEGRFGLTDPGGAAAVLDRLFQRRGDGWVDEPTIDGQVWPRVLIWLAPPDHLNVETSSREAYEQVDAVIKDSCGRDGARSVSTTGQNTAATTGRHGCTATTSTVPDQVRAGSI